jgi:hypothetical protein
MVAIKSDFGTKKTGTVTYQTPSGHSGELYVIYIPRILIIINLISIQQIHNTPQDGYQHSKRTRPNVIEQLVYIASCLTISVHNELSNN